MQLETRNYFDHLIPPFTLAPRFHTFQNFLLRKWDETRGNNDAYLQTTSLLSPPILL